MSKIPSPILTIDGFLVKENIIGTSHGYDNKSNYGFEISPPPDIILSIVVANVPNILLKYANTARMINELILDYSEGRTIEYGMVIIDSINKTGDIYTGDIYSIKMRALRVKIFCSVQEKKEFDLINLINIGEIFIGDKK